MLLYAWNETPTTSPATLDDIEDAPSLDCLLASVLVRLMQNRLRIGLGRNYINEQQALKGIRGRLLFTESLKRQAFERGQSVCEFQTYSLNVPKNQIVRSTLARLVQTGQFGADPTRAESLRHSLRRLIRDLDGVDLVELKLDFIRRQQLGRNDRDYRIMLAICELLLQRQMPADAFGNQRLPGLNRAELVMYRVYERFIANFYQIHLPGWEVTPQKRLGWHEKHPSPYLPSMQPDLLLREKSTGRLVVLDTKFTASSLLKGQWGNLSFNTGHLYQLYTYLKTQEHLSEQHRQASGILLYPAVTQPSVSERITLQEQTVRIESVDLSQPWQEIEGRLSDIMLWIPD
jgi:5-methylcytosine-specific restriction enzyme subunit McrC